MKRGAIAMASMIGAVFLAQAASAQQPGPARARFEFQVLEIEGSRIDRLTVIFEQPNEEPQAEVAAGG